MNPRYIIIILAILAALSASTAVRAQRAATLVQVDAIIREPLSQTFTVLGRLVARQRGVAAARVAGPVVEMRVQIGDRMRKGEVIAVIDRTRPAWRRDVAAAELHESEASRSNAEARYAMAEAGVARADARLALARQAVARLARLRASAAFSQARLDDLELETTAAVSDVEFARAETQQALSLIDQSIARIERRRADLAFASQDLADTVVRAAFDGVVTLRHTQVGAYLNVGSSVIALINDRDIEIEADVPFDRLDALSPGVEVFFQFEKGPWRTALVRAVGVQENSRSRTRSVRFTADFDGGSDNLADGQSVSLTLPIGPPRNIVSVHKDAITRSVDGAVVFVVADGVAMRRIVKLGEEVGSRFELLDGLEAGDIVVVRGNERLRPGQKIRYEGQPDEPS